MEKFGEDCLKYLDGCTHFYLDGNYLNLVTDRFSENHYLSMNKNYIFFRAKDFYELFKNDIL